MGAFEMVGFCNLHSLDKALKICQILIAQNFEMDYLLKEGLHKTGIDKKSALEILQMKIEKPIKDLQFTVQSTSSSDMKIAGIAVCVAAHTTAKGFLNLSINGFMAYLGKIPTNFCSTDSVEYLRLQNEIIVPPSQNNIFKINIPGDADLVLSDYTATIPMVYTEYCGNISY